MRKLRFFAALSLAFGSLLFATPAQASTTIQFTYYWTAQNFTFTDAQVTVVVTNDITNKIGGNGEVIDTYRITLGTQVIEVTEKHGPRPYVFDIVGTQTIKLEGIDNGYWGGNHGPIMEISSTPLTPPAPVIPQGALVVPEGSSAQVVAPEGQRISSITAWYGDPNNGSRGVEVSATLTQLAAGQTSVAIDSNNVYGDPAPGTPKVLIFVVSYETIPAPVEPLPSESPAPVEPSPTPSPEPTSSPSPSPSESSSPSPEVSPQPSTPPQEPLPEPSPSQSQQPEPPVQPTPEPTSSASPDPQPSPETSPTPSPSAGPEPAPPSEPEPIPVTPEPEPSPEPTVDPTPEVVVPDPVVTPEPQPEPEPEPTVEPEPAPEPEVTPAPEEEVAPEPPVVEPEVPVVPETPVEPPSEVVADLLSVPVDELSTAQVEMLVAAALETFETAEQGSPEYAQALEALAVAAEADDAELPAELAAIPLLGDVAGAAMEFFNDLGNIGADMSPQQREKAEETVVGAVIVGQVAAAAMGAAASSASTSSSTRKIT